MKLSKNKLGLAMLNAGVDSIRDLAAASGVSINTISRSNNGGMALGLEQGWDNEYGDIKHNIENGLKFNAAPIGVTARNATYGGEDHMPSGFMGGNSYSFTFNSPEALDPVTASRKAKRAAQMMALG